MALAQEGDPGRRAAFSKSSESQPQPFRRRQVYTRHVRGNVRCPTIFFRLEHAGLDAEHRKQQRPGNIS
jgi:hypothetical protein